jgi:hypothetical protein
MALRRILGLLGISLVPLLIIGTIALDHTNQIEPSASHYYYTSMRNGFVGILCCISLFLLSYHGYERADYIVSKLAGIFALGIAFFPTAPVDGDENLISIMHFTCTGVFFALLSFMAIVLFTKSKGHKTAEKIKRNRVYRVCGIIMAICVLCVPLSNITVIFEKIGALKPILIFETLALTAFGIAWLIKGEFLLADKDDK